MAKRKLGHFTCGKCGRTFRMAGHLGRHMAAMHGRRPKGVERPAGRVTPKQAGGPVELLADVRSWREALADQRAVVDEQVAALDGLLATLGGAVRRPATVPPPKPVGGRRRRMRRPVQSGTLRAYVTQVLKDRGKPMQVRDIAVAVRRAGYKSRSKELPRNIGKLLRTMPNVTRMGLGVFRLR